MKPKPRKQTDCLFFIELVDKKSGERRVSVGNFWAGNQQEAITEAERIYASFFRSLETNSVTVRATEIQGPEKRSARDRFRTDNQRDFFSINATASTVTEDERRFGQPHFGHDHDDK